MQSRITCLPVTALHTIVFDQKVLLLAGQGPDLHIYDCASSRRILLSRIFAVQTIHGIASDSDFNRCQLVIIGGPYVALLTLEQPNGDDARNPLVLTLSIPNIIETDDRVLKIHHNASDPSEFAALTANNFLLAISPRNKGVQNHVRRLARGPRSFLYSGDINNIDSKNFLIAAGSVFGEIIVWTCKYDSPSTEWVSRTAYRLMAHNGSVFGVSISDLLPCSNTRVRLLASCSDDRTIRLWDITNVECHDTTAESFESDVATGFGDATTKSQQVAMTWSHLSRIWGVHFLKAPSPRSDHPICLVSTGEDASCKLWHIRNMSAELGNQVRASLSSAGSDRHHAGKNIWALTHHRQADAVAIFSGGADGQIIQRIRHFGGQSPEVPSKMSIPFKDLLCDGLSPLSVKDYFIFSDIDVIAIGKRGDLWRFTRADQSLLRWQSTCVSLPNSNTILCKNRNGQVAIAIVGDKIIMVQPHKPQQVSLAHGFEHRVAWMQMANVVTKPNVQFTICIIVVFQDNSTVRLVWCSANDLKLSLITSPLHLNNNAVITSSAFDEERQIFVIGTRAGSVLVYRNVEPGAVVKDLGCTINAHGSDAVTSITILPLLDLAEPGSHQHECDIISTGRDGNYAIHRVRDLYSATGKLPEMEIVHRSSLPFGPNIEGACLAPGETASMPDLILYGFRSQEFVAWNETQHRNILSVECGGGHRSWAYQQDCDSADRGGTFVWTKAGAFNLFQRAVADNRVVQKGGHGREIKAFAASPMMYNDLPRGILNNVLVATGAEDTTIRIFSILQPVITGNIEGNTFRCVRTLDDHTTGVQHLLFSACGSYLFSSAGAEEFFVWRLTMGVPYIEIGVVLQDRMPKEVEDADARITNFDMRGSIISGFQIAATYSTGKVKIMTYIQGLEPGQGHFATMREILFGSFCLTQIRMEEDLKNRIVSAGTNGFLNLNEHFLGPEELTFAAHRVHQSGVLAMGRAVLDNNLELVFTGGDDNALGVTFVLGEAVGKKRLTSTMTIPKAHAAALTALDVLWTTKTDQGQRVIVVTAGNDQRVKIWQIEVLVCEANSAGWTTDDEMLEAARVTKLAEAWTGVADISNVGVLSRSLDHGMGANLDIMVVGVGMEVLRISTEEQSSTF